MMNNQNLNGFIFDKVRIISTFIVLILLKFSASETMDNHTDTMLANDTLLNDLLNVSKDMVAILEKAKEKIRKHSVLQNQERNPSAASFNNDTDYSSNGSSTVGYQSIGNAYNISSDNSFDLNLSNYSNLVSNNSNLNHDYFTNNSHVSNFTHSNILEPFNLSSSIEYASNGTDIHSAETKNSTYFQDLHLDDFNVTSKFGNLSRTEVPNYSNDSFHQNLTQSLLENSAENTSITFDPNEYALNHSNETYDVSCESQKNCQVFESNVHTEACNGTLSHSFPLNLKSNYEILITFKGHINWTTDILKSITKNMSVYLNDECFENVLVTDFNSGFNSSLSWFNKSLVILNCQEISKLNVVMKLLAGSDDRVSQNFKNYFHFYEVIDVKLNVIIDCEFHEGNTRLILILVFSLIACLLILIVILKLRNRRLARSSHKITDHITRPTKPVILVGESLDFNVYNYENPREPSVLKSDHAYYNKSFESTENVNKLTFESFKSKENI